MMDLALELGMPVGLLSRLMTEREFARWMTYIRKRQLPQARLELYLAQISFRIAQAFGSTNPKFTDFILDFEMKQRRGKRATVVEADDDDDDELTDADVEALKEEIGFNPRPRRVINGA